MSFQGGDEDEDFFFLFFVVVFPAAFFGIPKKGGSHLEGDGDGDADAEKACATVDGPGQARFYPPPFYLGRGMYVII